MLKPIRRLVTTRDANGRSKLLVEGPARAAVSHPAWPGMGATMLWTTDEVPADPSGDVDATDRDFHAMPHAGGVNFVVAQFPPEAEYRAMSPAEQKAARNIDGFLEHGDLTQDDVMIGMHVTDTIDHDIILSGQLTLILDSGEYVLGPGDAVIMRGDRHAWRNDGDEPALMAAATVSTEPSAKLAANKALVRRFFALCESDGFAAAGALVADDVVWWNAGFGELTKQGYAALAVGSEAHIEGGRYRFTIQALTAEEDRVSAVVDGYSRRTSGQVYANNYHFLFTIRDGVIVAIREYHDTQYAAGIWNDLSTMPGSAG
jgi:ketosteroid isomerase-like protein